MKVKGMMGLLAVLLAAVFVLSACGGRDNIVGQWEDRVTGWDFEFHRDGTLSRTIRGGYLAEFNWEITGNTLFVTFGNSTSTWEFDVQGDTLFLRQIGVTVHPIWHQETVLTRIILLST